MIKRFERIISKTQSQHLINIQKKNVTQQCSYNLPIEIENFLLSNNMIVPVDTSNPRYINYVLASDVEIRLRNNIIAVIGDSYNTKGNEAIFTHTEETNGSTPKLQLKKTEFSKKRDSKYEWFVDLYNKNFEGIKFIISVDNDKRIISFDLELTQEMISGGIEHQTEKTLEAEKKGDNIIYYGAPGCGKSYYVKSKLKQENVDKNNIFRVTFHPEYSNSDFIGQILPTIEKIEINEEIKEKVKYIFNPGPFAKALIRAYETDDMVYLIIEEINRGNAATIFGDVFQLLDRERDDSKENYLESQYPITNINLFDYVKDKLSEVGIEYREKDIVIPRNLTIIATMNTSDQNVFTLDTAFKRRWTFKQISNKIKEDNDHLYKNWYIPGTDVTWENFLDKLNDKIIDYKIENSTSEDKQIGKYFVTKDCLTETIENIDNCSDQAHNFAYKVLEYIWNDVCKYGQSDWFDTEKYRTLEKLIDGFIDEGLKIFPNIAFKE